MYNVGVLREKTERKNMSRMIMTMYGVPPLDKNCQNEVSVTLFCGPQSLVSDLKMSTRKCIQLTVNGETVLLNEFQARHLAMVLEQTVK